MSGSNHLLVSIAWHRTILSGPILILMEMAHSFSSIQQISCHIIALLCSDRRPAYFLMQQGPRPALCDSSSRTNVLLHFYLILIIKDQHPAPFLIAFSLYQGPMSYSISYSLRQLFGLVIRDI